MKLKLWQLRTSLILSTLIYLAWIVQGIIAFLKPLEDNIYFLIGYAIGFCLVIYFCIGIPYLLIIDKLESFKQR